VATYDPGSVAVEPGFTLGRTAISH
jgi:hypothetical protein